MEHFGSGKTIPCVAGGVLVGMAAALTYTHIFGAPSSCQPKTSVGPSASSGIWDDAHFTHPADTPDGFTMRPVGPGVASLPAGTAGVDCFLEKWDAGTAEPPHSHPGDDSTTVVEGEMVLQFFTKTASGELKKDGKTVTLKQGMTGYIASNRIHDAKYTEKCRLIYVHNSAFGFNAAA